MSDEARKTGLVIGSAIGKLLLGFLYGFGGLAANALFAWAGWRHL